MDRRHLVRIAVNVEQLLLPSPGGIGRYSGQLATLLGTLAPIDDVVPFVARHPRAVVSRAFAAAGITAAPVILPFPRRLVYESWVRWGQPPLGIGAEALRHVDVVHAPSVAVPGRGRVPLIATVHDAAAELWPEAFTPRGRRFHARGVTAVAGRADLVITVTAAAAEEIARHTPIAAERIRVVHHGIDPPTVSAAERARVRRVYGLGDRPFVLWVGSLEPRKGVGTLVSAMARLHRSGATDALLMVAGFDGWLSSGLIAVADRDALGDRLVTPGPLPEADLWALYASATIFALPSRHEGFGLPIIEAMSQGAPVMCSDLPVTREVAATAALFVTVGDVDAWSEELAGLLDDAGRRAALGAAGRIRAAHFSVEAFVAGTRAVYREATGLD
jgi:glycosyltransferase involved in cell wall biosynthesis